MIAALSLRALARRIGVSHAAPTDHFTDKAGLLTAVADEDYVLLGATLRDAEERTDSFLEMGGANVRFAVAQRPYFEVMYRTELYHADDPAVIAARAMTRELPEPMPGEQSPGRLAPSERLEHPQPQCRFITVYRNVVAGIRIGPAERSHVS